MNLARTTFYTSISTAVTFISAFIITKVVAVKIGPQGMAWVGQYLNITSILSIAATGAITLGVIKYLAQYNGDVQQQQRIITTAISTVLISSFIVSFLVISSCIYLSK